MKIRHRKLRLASNCMRDCSPLGLFCVTLFCYASNVTKCVSTERKYFFSLCYKPVFLFFHRSEDPGGRFRRTGKRMIRRRKGDRVNPSALIASSFAPSCIMQVGRISGACFRSASICLQEKQDTRQTSAAPRKAPSQEKLNRLFL